MEKHEAEELLARKLTEERLEEGADGEEAEAKAAKQLLPRWEIRIQAKLDPVVEETRAYRALAREVDDRYEGVKLNRSDEEEEDKGRSR
ncbi:hypothetical protein [Cohnella terricola]|uniref:Uncharacterized protein n=1 Tax=Cohnella terricola TaxID=1289167 RepID=A0A559JTP5_9BACL|nr:hypothetical protein [Cohnella terricola]TVY03210.1 hypothetical protein FPZ45_04865 [Cohnella terricola]